MCKIIGKSMQKVVIRNIEILPMPNREVFVDFLMNKEPIRTGVMVAINAEKMILAEENDQVAKTLFMADYRYADGISIVKSIQKKYPICQLERIAGVDLWESLMKRAAELNVPVYLVGAEEKVVNETAKRLEKWGVRIVGTQNGYFEQDDKVIRNIQESGAKFVTVAMGSPKQEIFMLQAKQYYPDCLYMGVGGTYDIFIGKVKRAPKIWQKLGLEWLYRLLKQPSRWQRQLRLAKFAYYYITKQL